MDYALHWLNTAIVDPYILRIDTNVTSTMTSSIVPGVNKAFWLGNVELTPSPFGHPYSPQYHWLRHYIVLSISLYIGSLLLYFGAAACTYFAYYREDRAAARTRGDVDNSRANRAW
jgi:hypothetical protein